jgi:ATP-binding cassette subfamily C (CFTR/MRP) protein 2
LKTRVFVTNSLSFLSQADEVMMIDNGSIVEVGTYEDLLQRKDGKFNNFIKSFLENNTQNQGSLM